MVGAEELLPSQWGAYPHGLADILPAALRAFGHAPDDNESAAGALTIPPSRNIIVVLIDGLGATLLDEHAALAPTLTGLRGTTLRAGFPATTAASITSLAVGVGCGAHGIIGYSFRPDDASRTSGPRRSLNALRWTLDSATGPSAVDVYPPRLVQNRLSALEMLAALGVRVTYVMPREFRNTGLTQVAFRAPGRHLPARTVSAVRGGVSAALTRAAVDRRRRPQAFVYAYYGGLDMAGHLHGPGSAPWRGELVAVDHMVANIMEELPGDTTLLVTGDHGMIEVGRRVDIDTTPELTDATELIAGEARVRHVYAVDGSASDVGEAWASTLGEHAHVGTRERALDESWFGTDVSDAVAARIGDVVAVARDSTVLVRGQQEPSEAALTGQHGAWAAAEQLVPLLVGRG